MLQYEPGDALRLLTNRTPDDIAGRLLRARKAVLADAADFKSRRTPAVHKLPLDAGFIEYPQRLIDDDVEDGRLEQIERLANRLRNETDSVVSLGIGGSYMGALALFQALCHRCHNELSRAERNNTPRLYFDGYNVDNDKQRELLELLSSRSAQDGVAGQWGIVVISKSGGTLETAAAFRLFREALSAGGANVAERVIPVTGATGKLRTLARSLGIHDADMLPVPDGIGGRFSVLTPVGLLPAAILGLDIRALLLGAADMTRRFFAADPGDNPVLDFVSVCHLFESDQKLPLRVLATWGDRLEAVGLWYDQLLAESLGKHERGPTPLTVVNTRDLHSRGQQHQEGRRDRLITNLVVEKPGRDELKIPTVPDELNADQLNDYAGISLDRIRQAALAGTNQAYADDDRPTATIRMSELSEYALGELFQMLMLATVVEGRLTNINPYGQPGVEAYKKNMQADLDAIRAAQ